MVVTPSLVKGLMPRQDTYFPRSRTIGRQPIAWREPDSRPEGQALLACPSGYNRSLNRLPEAGRISQFT
jgi:hypothetical protein